MRTFTLFSRHVFSRHVFSRHVFSRHVFLGYIVQRDWERADSNVTISEGLDLRTKYEKCISKVLTPFTVDELSLGV